MANNLKLAASVYVTTIMKFNIISITELLFHA